MKDTLFPPEVWVLTIGKITINIYPSFLILLGITILIISFMALTRKEEIDEIVDRLKWARGFYIAFTLLFAAILLFHIIFWMISPREDSDNNTWKHMFSILWWALPLCFLVPMLGHINSRLEDFETLQNVLTSLKSTDED